MSSTMNCPACGSTNPGQGQFCSKCGSRISDSRPAGAASSDGSLNMGNRDFLRRVPRFEFTSALGSLRVVVPRGTYGIVTVDGKAVALLPPGTQTAVALLDRLKTLFNSQSERTEVYLVDTRPLVIGESVEVMGVDGQVKKVEFNAEFHAPRLPSPLPRFDEASREGGFWSRLFGRGSGGEGDGDRFEFQAYENLINNLLRDRDTLLVTQVYEELKPLVTAAAQGIVVDPARGNALVLSPSAREPVEAWCERTGLRFVDRVAVKGSAVSVDLVVGGAPLPEIKRCVGCNADLQSTKRFCDKCGAQQPISADAAPSSLTCANCKTAVAPGNKFCQGCGSPAPKPPEKDGAEKSASAAFTKDGRQLEIDVFLRLESALAGASVVLDGNGLRGRAQDAIASLVRQRLALVNAADLTTREGLTRFEQDIVPDAQKAIQALNLKLGEFVLLDVRDKSGEWLLKARAEIEQEKQELLKSREWLAVDSEKLDVQALTNELAVRQRKTENARKFDEARAALEHRRSMEEVEQGNADLDISKAQREARTSLAVEAAGRDVDRARATAKHEDDLTAVTRGAEVQRLERSNERAEQVAQAAHEMDLEAQAAAHDANLARQSMKLDSERSRLGVDDEVYGLRARADHENQQADKKLDRELTAEERRQKAQLDKLRAMAELDAQIAQREIAAKQAEQVSKQDHEMRMRESLKGLSTEQMLAMQAAGPGGDKISEALATKFKSEAEANAGRLAAEAAANKTVGDVQAKLLEEARNREATMMQQNQQMMMQQFQQMMQLQMQQSAMALQAQQAASAATNSAYQQAAQQAQSMSERSMSSMSNVAGQASQRGPTVVVPPPMATMAPVAAVPASLGPESNAKAVPRCSGCGDGLAAGASFCNGCGRKVEVSA